MALFQIIVARDLANGYIEPIRALHEIFTNVTDLLSFIFDAIQLRMEGSGSCHRQYHAGETPCFVPNMDQMHAWHMDYKPSAARQLIIVAGMGNCDACPSDRSNSVSHGKAKLYREFLL